MFAAVIFATGMTFENQIPQRSVLLIGQGFRNRDEAFGQRQLGKGVETGLGTPFMRPAADFFRRLDGVMQQRHDVRLATAALTKKDERPALGAGGNSGK